MSEGQSTFIKTHKQLVIEHLAEACQRATHRRLAQP